MKMENPTLNHKNLGRFQAYAVIKAFNERNEISYVGGAKIELDSSMTDEKVPGLVRALESDVLDKLRNVFVSNKFTSDKISCIADHDIFHNNPSFQKWF